MLEQDLGQAYPPGAKKVNRQFLHINHPIHQRRTHWFYTDTNKDAPPNYDNCSYRDRCYYFTLDNRTEKEFVWNETQNHWDSPLRYRDPELAIPTDSELEETTPNSNSESSHNQTPIQTRNTHTIANMSGQASGTTPSVPTQPGREKVKLLDNYTGDRTESQKFILQCLLLFAAESNRYKTNSDKVSLVLSYMRYRMAGAWAENFLAKTVGAETPKDLGT